MDSLTHLFSSRRWPATRHRHSTAVNTQMDTTVVLLPPVPSAAAAVTTSSSHHAAAMDSLSLSLAPCPLFLLLPCDGRFWRVAALETAVGAVHVTAARVDGPWHRACVVRDPRSHVCGRILTAAAVLHFGLGTHAWAVGPFEMSRTDPAICIRTDSFSLSSSVFMVKISGEAVEGLEPRPLYS